MKVLLKVVENRHGGLRYEGAAAFRSWQTVTVLGNNSAPNLMANL
jgi:hypothetical protein